MNSTPPLASLYCSLPSSDECEQAQARSPQARQAGTPAAVDVIAGWTVPSAPTITKISNPKIISTTQLRVSLRTASSSRSLAGTLASLGISPNRLAAAMISMVENKAILSISSRPYIITSRAWTEPIKIAPFTMPVANSALTRRPRFENRRVAFRTNDGQLRGSCCRVTDANKARYTKARSDRKAAPAGRQTIDTF